MARRRGIAGQVPLFDIGPDPKAGWTGEWVEVLGEPEPRWVEVPPRPGRGRMPSTARIATHHGLPNGCCWRCGRKGRVERAHMITRCYWGLDTANNLVLLCRHCHLNMPWYRRGQEADAWRWVFTYDPLEHQGHQIPIFLELIKVDPPGLEIRASLWPRYGTLPFFIIKGERRIGAA